MIRFHHGGPLRWGGLMWISLPPYRVTLLEMNHLSIFSLIPTPILYQTGQWDLFSVLPFILTILCKMVPISPLCPSSLLQSYTKLCNSLLCVPFHTHTPCKATGSLGPVHKEIVRNGPHRPALVPQH